MVAIRVAAPIDIATAHPFAIAKQEGDVLARYILFPVKTFT